MTPMLPRPRRYRRPLPRSRTSIQTRSESSRGSPGQSLSVQRNACVLRYPGGKLRSPTMTLPSPLTPWAMTLWTTGWPPVPINHAATLRPAKGPQPAEHPVGRADVGHADDDRPVVRDVGHRGGEGRVVERVERAEIQEPAAFRPTKGMVCSEEAAIDVSDDDTVSDVRRPPRRRWEPRPLDRFHFVRFRCSLRINLKSRRNFN